jgi:polysaccharide biosynthesis protein PslH
VDRRVLFVLPEVPFPTNNGWALRHYQLIRAASSDSVCDVVALTKVDLLDDVKDSIRSELKARKFVTVTIPQKSTPIQAAWGLVTGLPLRVLMYNSPALRRVLARLTLEERYTSCVILGDICMAQYAKHVNAERIVWDMCDDIALSLRQEAHATDSALLAWYLRWQAKIVERYLKKASQLFDCILVIAKKDGRALGLHYSKPIIETPNPVDLERFQPQPQRKNNPRKVILFTGAMRYWANIEAVRFFVNEVFPLVEQNCGEILFHIVGNAADSLNIDQESNVVRTGFVEDLAPYYHSCDVFVCPLRSGTGIKNKLLEAMACGCAIVTTSIGAEGLHVCSGHELFIADTAAGLASILHLLLEDSALRQRLGANARQFVAQEFGFDKTRRRLLSAFVGSGETVHN